MHYTSTRDSSIHSSLSAAIRTGLAGDGGLFIPNALPAIKLRQFDASTTYADFSAQALTPFFADDPLHASLTEFCRHAFNFPVPLRQLNDNTFIMELFHGPTLSFKDFGARFLAECLNALSQQSKVTILVATSGDTGSAVAAALYKKPHINVVILYPEGQVSQRQEQQLTCWGENVLSLRINGSFDDCQHIVKILFTQAPLDHPLSSANSINIGRLLPQISYYAYHSTQFYQQYGVMPGFIVPSGNLGNVTAAYWAKTMGFPIREITLATNANRVLSDYLSTGDYQPRASISTLANAMDVGKPSNFERLQHLYPEFADFKANVTATSINDDTIKQAIDDCFQQSSAIICPHTATAYALRQQLSAQPWIVTATAHPCKFATIIEPIIGQTVAIAPQLQALLARKRKFITVDNDSQQVLAEIRRYF